MFNNNNTQKKKTEKNNNNSNNNDNNNNNNSYGDYDYYYQTAERFSDFIIGQGYKQVCGTADARGDGITPVESAQLQLEGVENIILEGVFHTPVGSNNEDRPWYGTKRILDMWVSKI